MNAPLRLAAALAVGLTLVMPAAALDWGGSLEESTSTLLPFNDPGTGHLGQSAALKGWVQWSFDQGATLMAKFSVPDSFTLNYDAGNTFTNTLSPNLDTLVYSTQGFWAGRSTLRDFGGIVLNTAVDGVRLSGTQGDVGYAFALGTTALLFKSASSVVISQADLADRGVTADWTKPETLFASPRAVAYAEASFPKVFADQTLHAAEVLQIDFRSSKVAKDGDAYDPTDPKGNTAPVSMSYTGFGGSGRLGGPWFWDAWAFAGAGITLTPVGTYTPGRTTPTVVKAVYPVWKTSMVLNALVNADLTLLLPDWGNTIVNLGVLGGSWDQDGASPDKNLAQGSGPTPYTGYFGVSRTGAALIFNPQPVNMVTTQLLWSVKPWAKTKGFLESLQLAASAFVFVRPTTYGITEAGLLPKSPDLYLASEADLQLALRPASDWGASLGLGLLVPNASALSRGPELKAQAGLNLSF